MTNKQFFAFSFKNELQATCAAIGSIPTEKLEYKPHPISRSAYEIAEHIAAHFVDMVNICHSDVIDEKSIHDFKSPGDLVKELEELFQQVENAVNGLSETDWEDSPVELLYQGNSIIKLPRMHLMWMFHNDIIHHRGQLSSYLRPMGAKNPAIYGWSADTL